MGMTKDSSLLPGVRKDGLAGTQATSELTGVVIPWARLYLQRTARQDQRVLAHLSQCTNPFSACS